MPYIGSVRNVKILNGPHDPPYPIVIVDGSGLQVDLSKVNGELFDRNTTDRIEWGLTDPSGHTFGRVWLKNGTARVFWDRDLMTPYLDAYNAEVASRK